MGNVVLSNGISFICFSCLCGVFVSQIWCQRKCSKGRSRCLHWERREELPGVSDSKMGTWLVFVIVVSNHSTTTAELKLTTAM